jgi:DNA-directed RNA polymerase sigma subunit (sigma70/sigma32)
MKEYSEDNLLLADDDCESGATGSLHTSTRVGAFSLRRAYYFAKTGKLLLSAEQQRALANLNRETDPAVKQQIIVNNLHKVVSLAKRYTNRGLEFLDLIREGNQGLIEALEKTDWSNASRFSIHATWYICRSIERAILKHNNLPKSCLPT